MAGTRGHSSKTGPDELKIALDNRVFELQLFWQRSNYFLVLITALGVATFTQKESYISVFTAIFATVASFFWYRTNLGSKFWQQFWENEVERLAALAGVRSFQMKIEEIRKSVADSLQNTEGKWLKNWINGRILTKPSVTDHMIMLSVFSLLIFAMISATLIVKFLIQHENWINWVRSLLACSGKSHS